MRVIVVEDLLLTRAGIVSVLVEHGIEVVGQAGSAVSLLDMVAEVHPDAVILDIRMPPTHSNEGIDAARELGERFPSVAVLVLSQYVESSFAVTLLSDRPQGRGYLLKERVFDPVVIVDALRRVVDGESVVDPTIVMRLMGRPRRPDPLAELTAREREVLGLLAEGLTNHGIAQRLTLAERTVETHITAIFGKLGLDETEHGHRRVLAVLAFLRRARDSGNSPDEGLASDVVRR